MKYGNQLAENMSADNMNLSVENSKSSTEISETGEKTHPHELYVLL